MPVSNIAVHVYFWLWLLNYANKYLFTVS